MKAERGLGGVVIAVIIALAAFGIAAPALFGSPVHKALISIPSADGLLAGGDVLEAGSKVGYIASVEPQTNNTALVTVEINDANWPLHQGVNAAVRPRSLLGEKYVDITDGAGQSAYDAARVIHAPQTAVPVELDQFVNSLDPTTRVATQTLLDDFGAGVAGQGANLNLAIATGKQNLQNLAITGKTLDNRDPQLDGILVGLDGVLSKITTSDQLTQFSQLITNGRTTLNAVEDQKTAFSRSFTDASATLTELNTALDSAVPQLQQTLNEAPDLTANLNNESALLAQVAQAYNNPSVLGALDAGLVHGPTATGGALEIKPDGTRLPIFRICFIVPTPGACTGDGAFAGQGTASTSADSGGQALSQLAAWFAS